MISIRKVHLISVKVKLMYCNQFSGKNRVKIDLPSQIWGLLSGRRKFLSDTEPILGVT